MATFRKRGNGWQVRVRRVGYPDEVKTLSTKFDAEQVGTGHRMQDGQRSICR